MSIVAVIPSRYASTRLPGKPLVDICGKTTHIAKVGEGIDALNAGVDFYTRVRAISSFFRLAKVPSGRPGHRCRPKMASTL